MHIALFSPGWPLSRHRNGVVTYVHWMREALLAAGHQVSVFTARLSEPEAGVCEVRPTGLHAVKALLRSKLDPGEDLLRWGQTVAQSIVSVHRQRPIDVVEMEESFGWFADVGRHTGLPVVVKLHGPAFLSLVEEELATPFATRKIDREGVSLMHAHVITSPSLRTLVETTERYGLLPDRGLHIVNPVVLGADAPVWSLATCHVRTLLFVGRFDKRKGGDLVLKAFGLLAAVDPTLALVFVGPDAGIHDERDRLVHFQEMVEACMGPDGARRVQFRGTLLPEAIQQLRAEALVTIVASRWENQSYTALEAMLQGCPVVSSDTGGQGEIIVDGESGLLFRTGDAADLAAKLRSVLDDPLRAAQLGETARRHALERHAPGVVAAQTIAAYRRAIAANAGHP